MFVRFCRKLKASISVLASSDVRRAEFWCFRRRGRHRDSDVTNAVRVKCSVCEAETAEPTQFTWTVRDRMLDD